MVRSCVVSLLVVISLYCLAVAILNRYPSTAYAQVGFSAASGRGTERAGYVGDSACLSCHKERSVSYSHTSHHLTSQLASKDAILGSFGETSNVLMISNPETTALDPRLYFKMEGKEDGFYQTAVAERGTQRLVRSERIDIVIGSGVRGQTYLFWSGDNLYELPVSYWSDGHQWINSPGYRDGTANFGRHVDSRCLECHATYIRPLSLDPQTNVYDRTSLVTGISCESCHGAGADHVASRRDGAEKPARAADSILNPAKFERDRQIDQCALCHNGTQRVELVPAFMYLPGRPLDKYLAANPADTLEHPEVHGNQVGLLKRSRCYLSSPRMSCSTCHNVHAPEDTAAKYSKRCLSCHRWQSCGISRKLGGRIARDCIDCHMPREQTNAIVSETAGKLVRASIRNHWIKIYSANALPDH